MDTSNEIKLQEEYIKKVKKINQDKNLKYTILTMGCQLNENDSEKLCGMLEKMGYTKTEKQNDADLALFNTCCVRENAEDKLFGKLGELKRLKEQKGIIIAIGGCMMQEKHITDKIKESYPFVDILFGTHTLHKFPEDLYKVIEEKRKLEDILDIDGKIYEGLPIKRDSKIKASVTIMNGCNNFCSYCIVPYVRGRERSRQPRDIIEEVKKLAKEGYKEITLLGQNVNSYLRVEREKNIPFEEYQGVNSFATLLRAINKIDGIERIRFISPHPKDFTDDVIEAIADCEKVCKLVHLPLQSGNTKVLKEMNRKYTKEQYLNLVEKMKNKIPNLTLSTDIIVGFPGETDEEFEDTLEVVEKVGFEQVYMFIYSRRVGTPGDKMQNQIPEDIKHKRFDKLKALVESQIEENNKKYIGTTQKILVEGESKNNSNMLSGRTESNKVVIFEGSKELIDKIINIKIISQHMWYLKGEILK
ncbi:MAG TPA: tRNA (N6-isopentenyl adenosine(37)-C2)-methylthiotransferase MiaB [Clostridiaceae bacterium]|mgnify:FL=1|jgi:tRNA-2-methylthio-N6-dimethylallyladenosine synthase|nr:tRNA (N6-isopentenyl adenosine(37)-C2)-methylthiotransferase MiaB [Clostridiaceae bacterium]